jgi:hypothetical protein
MPLMVKNLWRGAVTDQGNTLSIGRESQLIGKVGLPGGLRDLSQQPKCVSKALVMRSSFESMVSGIGTWSGDPYDISSFGDEADWY